MTLRDMTGVPGGTFCRLVPAKIVHRTVGVVDKQHSSAVLFATVKGAYVMSMKIVSFFAFVV